MRELKFASDRDAYIYQEMLAYMKQQQETENPVMPLFWHDDPTVDVDKMLTLSAFADFKV